MQGKKHRATTSPSTPKRALLRLVTVLTNRKFLALLGILALGAYLRSWNIDLLFNVIHDYDEGAYSIGARLISEGYLPYQDFLLVHPPLYNLVLAAVYKVFSYSFFYGRYLSIALSLTSIVVIYLIGQKMYHPRAGLIAAAIFAVSPEMIYDGRRAIQEPMGILLILVAIYFAADFINNRKQRSLLWCGLTLGLAMATKYLFIPAVVGIILAIVLLTMGDVFWQTVKKLGQPMLWVIYICFATIFCSLLLLFKWGLHMDISVPFIDPLFISPENLIVIGLVFVLPFLISIVLLEKEWPFKKWWLALWGLRRNNGLWLLGGGTTLGFIFITGFFLIQMPQEFGYQTIWLQQNRPDTQFSSFITLIMTVPSGPDFLKTAFLPVLLMPILIIILLNKQTFSKSDCFLAVALTTSFLLCQTFIALPRYYVSAMPFLFLGIASLVPAAEPKMLTARTTASVLAVLTIFLVSLNLSLVLLKNYSGYNVNPSLRPCKEVQIYNDTLDYLESTGAEKIYSTNPILPALSTKLNSSTAFDTYALLLLEQKPPQEIMDNLVNEDVDFVLFDASFRDLVKPYYKQATELMTMVRDNSHLVKTMEPNSSCRIEIYRLGADTTGIFNGDFELWGSDEEMRFPLGWEHVLVKGEGDIANISEEHIAGKRCVELKIYEDGEKNETSDYIYAGITQKIDFPKGMVRVQVLPKVNTDPSTRYQLSPGIHFIDEGGHSLVVGFSDMVKDENIFEHEGGYRMLVLKEAQLNEWKEQAIDLAGYWSQAGWPQPKEINILFIISTSYTNPGYYTFYVSQVKLDDTKPTPIDH